MKNIFKGLLSLSLVFALNSCEESNNVIDQVVEGTENGAVLRTISVNNNVLNSSDPSTAFSVTVEEQDVQDGGLFASVDVYVSIRDLSPDNGTTTAKDAFIKNIPASDFTTGPLGLPRGTVSATYGEAAAAMGFSGSEVAPGDLFVFELRLNLTDGRTFGAADAGGIITGGFFASPYLYNAAIVCSPLDGDYRVDMHDSYGDGWQTNSGNGGNGITVEITDANDNVYTEEIGLCSNWETPIYTCVDEDYDGTTNVTVPVGAQLAIWNFPGDNYGEISFEIYAPTGELLLAVGLGEGTPGLLPVTKCK